ncbi:MAG TPA: hypothetical protein DCO86_00355 [Spirochaetaceae bacterium]|nr:hypothetical protein [Spirochaetaceae bacterium]
MREERLLEPARYYTSELKAAYRDRLVERFEELTKKSGIDVEANKATVRSLNEENGILDGYRRKKGLWIFFLIFSIAVVAVVSYFAYKQSQGWSRTQEQMTRAALEAAGIGFFGFLAIQSIIKIGKYAKLIKNQEKVVKRIEGDAWNQVSPLLSIMNTEDFCNIVHDIAPAIEIAPYIPSGFVERLRERSDRENELLNHINFLKGESITTVSSLSGCVDGKLFMVMSYVRFVMGTKIYTCSITLPYRDYVTDSNGNRKAVTRYETLTASVEKPYPYYHPYTRAIYFSEACPNLTFFRNPVNINAKSEKQFEKEVKKAEKKFIKIEKKSLKSGGKSFTPLSDTKFEALFNTEDRDNDVEFRMMYTPYAISQFTDFVKSAEGFGDNFYLEKDGCATSCILEGGQLGYSDGIRPGIGKIASFDYDLINRNFAHYGDAFFKNFYFCLAPLFMIPVYAEGRDEDFSKILSDSRPHAFDGFDAESLAAKNPELFRPAGTVTDVIIKSASSKVVECGTLFAMKSSSFRGESRVELVYRVGFHVSGNVPVHWTEYIMQSRTVEMLVAYLGLAEGQMESLINASGCRYPFVCKDGFAGFVADRKTLESEEFVSVIKSISASAEKLKTGDVAKQINPAEKLIGRIESLTRRN